MTDDEAEEEEEEDRGNSSSDDAESGIGLDDRDVYPAEAILDQKQDGKKRRLFLVQWQGYDTPTCEPEENVTQDLADAFFLHRRHHRPTVQTQTPPSSTRTNKSPSQGHRGCTNNVRSRNLCFAHGGGKQCAVTGCTKAARNGGKCWRRGPKTPCARKGCSTRAQTGGLCILVAVAWMARAFLEPSGTRVTISSSERPVPPASPRGNNTKRQQQQQQNVSQRNKRSCFRPHKRSRNLAQREINKEHYDGVAARPKPWHDRSPPRAREQLQLETMLARDARRQQARRVPCTTTVCLLSVPCRVCIILDESNANAIVPTNQSRHLYNLIYDSL